MKKRIFALLILVFLMCMCFGAPAFADEKYVRTDKAEYIVGEDIVVTASGTGKDWVGLYRADDTLESDFSIYWYYAENSGSVKIREAAFRNDTRQAYFDIPSGDYVIYLLADDGYEVLDSVSVSVKESPSQEPEAPAAPASVSYERTAVLPGLAEGRLIIHAADSENLPEDYIIYWADTQGALADYTSFAPIACSAAETVYEIEPGSMFPQSADRMLIYARKGNILSETASEVMLPAGSNDYDLGDLRYEFQVVSDIHITTNQKHIHNQHFAMLLEDIKTISPGSVGLFVNGDTADSGNVLEYKRMRDIVDKAGDGLPPLFFAIGNHDYMNGQREKQISNFLEYTGTDSDTVYHDEWINDVHFVFLGGEQAGLHAELSEAQLTWLEETLAKNRDENRPIYLFLHQGLMDTVAGCFEYQDWHGINQSEELSAIIKQYPEIIMFSGHSHWEMDSVHTMKERDENLPTIFNTASCAYLWSDDCMATNVGIEGSQGYYIYAYDHAVIVRGRDIAAGKWIASSQYFVNYGTEAPAAPSGEETASSDSSAADPSGEGNITEKNTFPIWGWVVIAAAVVVIGGIAVVLLRKKH